MAKKNTKTEQKEEDGVIESKNTSKKVTEPKKEVVSKKEPVSKKVKKEIVKEVVSKDDEELVEEDDVAEEENGDAGDAGDAGVVGDKKKRVAPTRDSVMSTFDEIIESIEKEIEVLRDSSNKTKGIKFLRTINKRLKGLKSQSSRIISKRNPTQRKVSNTTSGFLKPVPISKEIAKFAGWASTEKKSRVEVTKYLCNYIREHKLQNDKDKRQIRPDTKLAKLLNYDAGTSIEPLTYFRLQSLLKTHFPKDEVAV